jgi:hypothetical protein
LSLARSDSRDIHRSRPARARQRLGLARRLTHPDEHRVFFVECDALDVDQFILEIRKVSIIDGELSREGSVRDAFVLLEPLDNFVHDLRERHGHTRKLRRTRPR